MNLKKVFVYGAGGHGKVVADILLAAGGWELRGFVDDSADQSSTVLGYQVFSRDVLYREAATNDVGVALGIGNNVARRKIAERCIARGIEIVTAIHPSSVVSPSSSLGPGVVVMAGAVINPCADVGAGVIVNSGAVVEHDVVIGDYAHVSPNSTMGGAARLGVLSQLGIGAVMLPGVSIGDSTIVGAGSVVVRNIPGGVVALGVPAKVRRQAD